MNPLAPLVSSCLRGSVFLPFVRAAESVSMRQDALEHGWRIAYRLVHDIARIRIAVDAIAGIAKDAIHAPRFHALHGACQ